MRSLLIGLAAVLFGCNASLAQLTPFTPNAPAMGTTSPLGIPGAASPVGPVGIPLGATSLAPGGLSPAPFDPTAGANPCVGAGAATSSASGMTTSTFDAGGANSGMRGLSGSCGPGTSAGTVSGTASTSSFAGGIAGSVSGGGIPLGATELDSAGVSPLVTSPVLSNPLGIGASAVPMLAGSSPLSVPGRFGYSTAAGSGGLATGPNDLTVFGASTAAGSGGLPTNSTDRQTFGFSTGAGSGGRSTGTTFR